MDVLFEYATGLGLEVRYETHMVKLEQDGDGRVTGVIAKNAESQYIRINASNGVIPTCWPAWPQGAARPLAVWSADWRRRHKL